MGDETKAEPVTAAPATERSAPAPASAPTSAIPLPVRVVGGVVLAAVLLYIPQLYNPETNQILSQIIYLAIAAMGLNLLTGFNGQVSIGHGAFFGLGAYTSALLMVHQNLPFELTIVVAAVLSAALGVAVGFPALRVKGSYLALITLGLAVMFPVVARRFVKGDGGTPLVQPDFIALKSPTASIPDDIYRYYLCLGVLVVLCLLIVGLMKSRAGRAIIAVRDQEVAAETVGIDVARVKVTTFAISAAYAGIAGALSTFVDGQADASNVLLYFQKSIEFLIAVVIGGAATITGPILGAILLTVIKRKTSDTEAMAPALLGGALILVVFVLPDGIIGGLRRLVARLRGRSGAAPPHDPLTATSPSPT